MHNPHFQKSLKAFAALKNQSVFVALGNPTMLVRNPYGLCKTIILS